MISLLSIVTFLPLIAAIFMAIIKGDDEDAQRNAKWLALAATTFTFLISIAILVQFDPQDTGFQLVEEAEWLFGLTYKVGVDGISVLFVMLTTFLMPLVVAACWGVTHRVKEYMMALLVLETLMIGVFVALDLVLFYIFFEGGLIPMFLIIGIWGGKDRIYAAFKFFLYTFLGSVFMLVAMVGMYLYSEAPPISRAFWRMTSRPGRCTVSDWQIVGDMPALDLASPFSLAFAVKIPMWPVHTWLPDAHVEAPTGGVRGAGGRDAFEDGRLRFHADSACRCSPEASDVLLIG